MIKDIFSKQVTDEIIDRINRLQPQSTAQWGKMNVSQMLAHCNVTYDYTYTPEKFKAPGVIKKFFLKTLIKKYIVGPQPYRQNIHTAPDFIIADSREFETEKKKLIDALYRTQQLGRSYFEGRENFSFGKMTAEEWNTMYYKHIDHHLRQFGV